MGIEGEELAEGPYLGYAFEVGVLPQDGERLPAQPVGIFEPSLAQQGVIGLYADSPELFLQRGIFGFILEKIVYQVGVELYVAGLLLAEPAVGDGAIPYDIVHERLAFDDSYT